MQMPARHRHPALTDSDSHTDAESPDASFKIQLVSASKEIIYVVRRDKTAKLFMKMLSPGF